MFVGGERRRVEGLVVHAGVVVTCEFSINLERIFIVMQLLLFNIQIGNLLLLLLGICCCCCCGTTIFN